MRILPTTAVLVAAALSSTSAPAQKDSGQSTETQDRRAHPGSEELIWNLLGALGLIGLTGMWRSSDNDGYTNDPI